MKFIYQLIQKAQALYDTESFLDEDKTVLDFLDNTTKYSDKTKKVKILEVGSGKGRFALIINDRYQKQINLTCLEINKDLAELTSAMGISTIRGNILSYKLKKNNYDVVHCSHVVEHFGYPEVVKLLDKLFSIVTKKGVLIIRTPLMHDSFYLDIDHVRPYPPETILNYYSNIQQQVVGKIRLKELARWYRRSPLQIKSASDRLIIQIINACLKICWVYFKIPYSKPNGYISIFQKL